MRLFFADADDVNPDALADTERVPVPLVVRIPIDVEDVLNDFDSDSEPVTQRLRNGAK